MLQATQASDFSSSLARVESRAIDWIRPETGVGLIIVLGGIFRLLAAYAVGLGYGESYHFSCAIRPNLSYFDHPPMAVWLSALSMKFLQSVGPVAIRLPFILMFAGTTWMMFLLGRRLFSPWAGFYAALLLNLSAVFTLSVASFLQSDGPLMFFWMACVLCLTHIFLRQTCGGRICGGCWSELRWDWRR
ncbi:MAG: glycosyltransferase family 39 protein [Planctomycetota bacterium]